MSVSKEKILKALQDRQGRGVTVAVLSFELGYKTSFIGSTLERLYKFDTRGDIVRINEGELVAWRWKEGAAAERYCECGHAWWQHEGTVGPMCMQEDCDCGIFREHDEETETSEMTIDRDQALAFQATLIGAPKVMVHFEAVMGFGKVPQKPTDFDSKNAARLDRCEEFLVYQIQCAEILLEGVRNREREPERAEDDGQQELPLEPEEVEAPRQAVIRWHPKSAQEQKEVIETTTIEGKIYIVRHQPDGKSETLFVGATWGELVEQVMARGHSLEPLPGVDGQLADAGDVVDAETAAVPAAAAAAEAEAEADAEFVEPGLAAGPQPPAPTGPELVR